MSKKMKAFRLMGIQLPSKTSNENQQSNKDCGQLWQRFEKEKIFEKIPNKLTSEVFAVYFDYDSDETSPFAYFIGCQVPVDVPLPEDLKELTLPEQGYEQFIAQGQMPDCIAETWRQIWTSGTKRKFGYDFERYDERSQDWTQATVDIFISVQP